MLKDNKYNNSSTHFSYNDYKKKVKKGPNKDLMIFVSVFLIGLLIILGFVKILSPNVDVEIASNDEYSQEEENIEQNSIDERLKDLQLEDSDKQKDDEQMFSSELDEKVVIPKQSRKTEGEKEAEDQKIQYQQKAQERILPNFPETIKPQQTTTEKKEPASAPAPAKSVNAKVVVGYYATNEQAEVAKSIIQDAGIGVTPIVKNMGNYYTLQVGSYTSAEKAQQAANDLLKSNFPARVIQE